MCCEGCNPLDRCLGYGRDVRSQPLDVWYRPLPVVEQSRSGCARAFVQWYLSCRPTARPPPLVAAVSREHVMVDDECIGAWPEQFRQSHLRWCPLCINVIERVVLGN